MLYAAPLIAHSCYRPVTRGLRNCARNCEMPHYHNSKGKQSKERETAFAQPCALTTTYYLPSLSHS
eukprot:scaffold24143_cov146-Isochrysis_galbana.AAC.6